MKEAIHWLVRQRKIRDLSQAELGRLLEMSGDSVGNWENERTKPQPATMRALATVLGLPLEEVIAGMTGRPLVSVRRAGRPIMQLMESDMQTMRKAIGDLETGLERLHTLFGPPSSELGDDVSAESEPRQETPPRLPLRSTSGGGKREKRS